MNIKEWDREDWGAVIAIILAISCFIICDIMLINGTMPAMSLGYATAREEVIDNGFGVFIAVNIFYMIIIYVIFVFVKFF